MSIQGDRLRKERRSQGLCVQCGKPANGKSRCPEHLRMAAKSRREYVARMTPDARERMMAKEIQRRKMAKDMAVEIRHNKYLEEVAKLDKKEPLNVTVKLKPMAMLMIEGG